MSTVPETRKTASPEGSGESREQVRVVDPVWGNRIRLNALRVAVAVAALIGWQIVGSMGNMGFWTSTPTAVVDQLVRWHQRDILIPDAWITLKEALYGFALGSVGGAGLGFALGWMRRVGDVLEPHILALYTVPKIALGPLFVIFFGIGIGSKVALAALAVFFLVFFTTFQGMRDVDEELLEVCRVFGANSWQTLLKIGVPHATAWVFTGLKIALPRAMVGAVVGEFLAATKGIGFQIKASSSVLNTDGVFAGVVILVAMSAGLSTILKLIELRMFRWRSDATTGAFGG